MTTQSVQTEYSKKLSEMKKEFSILKIKTDVQIEDLILTKLRIRDVEERLRVLEENGMCSI